MGQSRGRAEAAGGTDEDGLLFTRLPDAADACMVVPKQITRLVVSFSVERAGIAAPSRYPLSSGRSSLPPGQVSGVLYSRWFALSPENFMPDRVIRRPTPVARLAILIIVL